MDNSDLIDAGKVSFFAGISLYFVKVVSCLFARGFRRFLTLEFDNFKTEFKKEIITEIKTILANERKK